MKIKKEGQKLVFLCLLCIFSASASYGQATLIVLILGDKVASEKLYLSIDGAMNLSNLPGIDGSSTSIGVNYGLGVHIRLNDKWYLKPEFKPLSRKGATNIDQIAAISGDYTVDKTKIKINYMDFPILVQYNINQNLWVAAGPQISFVTDANQFVFGTSPDGLETDVKVNVASFFNKTNFSFPVEAGYAIYLSSKRSTTKFHVNIFARYEYGFVQIFKDPSVGSSNISLFQLGLSLPFIKKTDASAKTIK